MTRLNRLVALLALVTTMGALGTAGGLTVRSAFAQSELESGCEQDECEGGTTCKDNSGHNTSCSYDGSRCATDGCAAN